METDVQPSNSAVSVESIEMPWSKRSQQLMHALKCGAQALIPWEKTKSWTTIPPPMTACTSSSWIGRA
eukprot:1156510-Pelagomonas_calceolata.AAC.1